MNYRKLLKFLFLFSINTFILKDSVFSQDSGNENFSGNEREIDLKVVYKIDVKGHADSFRFMITIPGTLTRKQLIKKRNFSMKPDTIFSENNNTYAVFTSHDLEKGFKITMKCNLEIYRNISNVANNQDDSIKRYLAAEKNIESDNPEIKRVADSLKHTTDIETVIETFNYVQNHIEYKLKAAIGAKKVLESGEGKCMDFSDLFVALLRANKIPAKSVYGITEDFYGSPFHAWAEAYLKKQGWVLFDATTGHSSIFRDGKNYKMSIDNKYIVLSEGRNDSVMHGAGMYRYSWKNKNSHEKPEINVTVSTNCLPDY